MKFAAISILLLTTVIFASHEPDHKINLGDHPEQKDFLDDTQSPSDFTRNDDLDENTPSEEIQEPEEPVIKAPAQTTKKQKKLPKQKILPPGTNVTLEDAGRCKFCAVYDNYEYDNNPDDYGRIDPVKVICGKTQKGSTSWDKASHVRDSQELCYCAQSKLECKVAKASVWYTVLSIIGSVILVGVFFILWCFCNK